MDNFKHNYHLFSNLVKLERGYYTDSDVFLADSVDLADISDFFADYLHLLSRLVLKFKNHHFSPAPRIRLGPSASAPASAPALGPSRMRGAGEKW